VTVDSLIEPGKGLYFIQGEQQNKGRERKGESDEGLRELEKRTWDGGGLLQFDSYYPEKPATQGSREKVSPTIERPS